MNSIRKRSATVAMIAVCAVLALALPACGGGAGGSGAGRGIILLSFSQDSVDNVVLNARLRFNFSEPVDPLTVNNASIQIREGPEFGQTVPGLFIVDGATVMFEPVLAALCDQSDSGLKPDTTYRVQVIGAPEEFAVRNIAHQPVDSTRTYEFSTRSDTDPSKYSDQIPSVGPLVLSTSPANRDQAVSVAPGNRIEIVLSENVDPCTITSQNVRVSMYESGDPNVMTQVPGSSPARYSGFDNGGSTADSTPLDPFTWGAPGTTSYAASPRKVLCDLHLEQDFSATRLVVTPLLGFSPDPARNASLFPENALLVVELTFQISDYGGLPMTPTVFAFTTENLASSTGSYLIKNEGETPYIKAQTTAAVDPDPRAPGRVQGYMLFSGDGDNGANPLRPSLPKDVANGCQFDIQANDGTIDNFDPGADVLLDTGSTPNTCTNSADGSTAVVWEFATFRVRSGRTIRIVGRNPAIILVQGDIVIENGGRLLVYGDGQNGAPQGRGGNGEDRYTSANHFALGGSPVAGAGKGGNSTTVSAGEAWAYGEDGFAGFGSPDYDPAMAASGSGNGGLGGGEAGSPSDTTTSTWDGSPAAGGGGGHAVVGTPGQIKQGTVVTHKLPSRGGAGGVYGDDDTILLLPQAGSGGGSSGCASLKSYSTSTSYGASGGAGGAGGGFVDLTSSGNVEIQGSVLALGSAGGNGDGWSAYGASSGGGGGSGGAVRVLTPNDIILSATAVVSTAGGPGGSGYPPYSNAGNLNNGGDGGFGRIALEDSDGVIAGLAAANMVPAEGSPGFYRGKFDAGRFKGGGLQPRAVSGLIPIGNYAGFDPTFLEPIQVYGANENFKVGVPVGGSPGAGKTAIMVEVRGYQMKPDGSSDTASATGWVTVGYFKDSGVENSPTWVIGPPGDVTAPTDNTAGPGGFTELNGIGGGGFEFLQVRFTFFLPPTVGPFDPGAYLDDWLIRFTHNL